ncbi:MAG TPA: acetyl-CoA carboxylase, carboxyltransferase subunit beta [Candidatus Eisenbacteria bacterium]
MSWLKRETPGPRSQEKRDVPEGLWVKCDSCGEIIYKRELERNLHVCPKCGHHFRIGSRQYATILLDGGQWEPFADDIESVDPLNFIDSKPYPDRYAAAVKKTKLNDAVLTATGNLSGRPVVIAFMDFGFIGGSMGSVVGEKIARAIETARDTRSPILILSSSGGARMMEGILSLMQMAKTSALLAELREMAIPFISILTNPTTGGVTASFASLGDVILAEPKALVGFAGPRVIRETVMQELPPGFQRSEFLLEHGMVDMIVGRHELKPTIGRLLDFLSGTRSRSTETPAEPPESEG